jgi:hypothetical protein
MDRSRSHALDSAGVPCERMYLARSFFHSGISRLYERKITPYPSCFSGALRFARVGFRPGALLSLQTIQVRALRPFAGFGLAGDLCARYHIRRLFVHELDRKSASSTNARESATSSAAIQ